MDGRKESLRESFSHVSREHHMKLGITIFSQAKSAEIPYSEVSRKAERLWPLWA